MRTAHLVVLAAFVAAGIANKDVFVSPSKPGSKPAAFLMFLPGALQPASGYQALVERIQTAAAGFDLWAAVPHFTGDLPVAEVHHAFNRTHKHCRDELGMPESATVFVGGHSLGSSMALTFAAKYGNDLRIAGALLTGGVIQRSVLESDYDVPTIAANGDLDGLMRVTRTAEAYYKQITLANRVDDRPVVVVPGAAHAQATTDAPSFWVKQNDITPDISLEDAQEQTAHAFGAFMTSVAHPNSATKSKARATITEKVKEAGVLLEPLILAMQLEGSYNLAKPCNSDNPSPHCPYYAPYPTQKHRVPSNDTTCTCGCPWTMQVVQPTISGLEGTGYDLVVRDAFHNVNTINPFHHPHIWNNCSGDMTCVLNISSVSQLIYPIGNVADTGFTYNTASEIRVKAKSRQAIYRSTVDPDARVEDTDKGSLCGEANQKAYKWAKENAGELALQRFAKWGQPMVFGEDIVTVTVGPVWINSKLHLEDTDDEDGNRVLKVTSLAMKTDVKVLVPMTDGYHYCKVLSPARAMEWLYLDGLRYHKGLKAQ